MAKDIFTDLDFNFTPHPVSGDLVTVKNESAVKNAVKNLIQTAFYERPFQPDLGSPVGRLLFEPSSPILKVTMEKAIRQVLENYEPRIEIENIVVTFNDDQNEVRITIYFRIVNTLTPLSVAVALQRTR